MNFVRTTRRVLIAAASVSALLLAAACGGGGGNSGGGGGGGGSAAADWTKQGDTEFWAGKDTSGFTQKLIDAFNAQHPNGKVTFHELSAKADEQRQQMIQNTQIKNPKMGILSMDVVWTSEFAAKGYVEALPSDVSTAGMLKPPVDAATYFNKLYGLPTSSDGGLLYYRTDLLKKYNIDKPPTTFDEMKSDCETILKGENNSKLSCFAGQYNKYEGLTCNFDEAVHGAGGVIVGDDGKPNVATPEAAKGLQTLADWFKDGLIPKAAITWQEEEGRTAFQHGELIFHRNWGYVYAHGTNDKDSVIKGKFDAAALPGISGPGVSTLGGHSMAVGKYADNKGTALDFMKFASTPAIQKQQALEVTTTPVTEETYKDSEVLKKFPFFTAELASVQSAKPRPKAVEYGDVTLALQDAAYGVLQDGANGKTADAAAALQALQTKLQTLIKS